MLRPLVALCFFALPALPARAGELSPELQFALTSLRSGERARVEKALGPVETLPLYRGDFEVDLKLRRVSGKVAVTLTPTDETREVLFRVTPNATHPGSVIVTGVKVNGASAPVAQPDPSLYRVVVDPPLPKGEPFTVELKVTATVPRLPRAERAQALHDGPAGDYGAFSVTDDVWSLAGLMPMVPAELNGKVLEGPSGIGDLGTFAPANFIVSVAAPAGWKFISSGQQLGEIPQGNGLVRTAYTVAAARELPLFLMNRPEVKTKQQGEVLVEAYTFKADEKSGQHVVEHAAKALELLEARIGPYPFKTFRVVEAHLKSGAGGMEFPGLVTVSATLYGGDTNPLQGMGLSDEQAQMALALMGPALKELVKNTLEFTIDHEVVHQYVAMLVGSDPITEPLTDEALTQHLALLVLEWRQGKKAATQLRDGQLKMTYQLHRMMGGADGKANRPTHEYASNREYAALVYGKAPLGFDAMRELVGADAWQAALKKYVEDNRYRWVTSQTLVEQVSKAHPALAKKLKATARHWFDEAHGDEDVGGTDLQALLGGAGLTGPAPGSGQGLQGVDPQLLKAMEELMKALGGP